MAYFIASVGSIVLRAVFGLAVRSVYEGVAMSSELWMVLEPAWTIAFIIGVLVLLVFAALRLGTRLDAQQVSLVPPTNAEQRRASVLRMQRELAERAKFGRGPQ